ncbi:hypothetical protein F4781DRAFT_404978 [Annulohypoxylon bovei var. microspora]|nr:hypothetical protein F4781DRAFT_404978 [Annulohypoxylon bovei var. microspora]
MSSTSDSGWPDTSIAIRHLLDIQHGDTLKCHNRLSNKSMCRNPLSKATVIKITELTQSIASNKSIDHHVLELLKELASAVMCKRWHQDEASSKAQLWEKKLDSLARSPQSDQSRTASHKSQVPHTPTTDEAASETRKPSGSIHREPTCHRFEYYCRDKWFFETNSEVKHQLIKPLSAIEQGQGFLYSFRLPESHSVNGSSSREHVKIGCSNNVDRRLTDISRICHYQPQMIGAWEMPNPRRYERIIHLLLNNTRMSEPSGCPGCHVRHKEWFKFKKRDLHDLIRPWQQWATLKPYNKDGCLLPVWKKRLDNLDLGSPTCWVSFLRDTW